MNLVLDLFRTRRSYRKYSEKPIDEAVLKQIMEVGLISPTGDNFKTVELILIKDKDLLNEIASMRKAAAMLRHAGAAIIVLVNTQKTDLWIEDGAISASYMHLAADALGIGSCWIQVRARDAVDGKEFEENFKRNSIYQSI
ncbi:MULTISPECIES: nitroreductase family protein [Allobaculum]|uniref:nitroreductase family protein n=1 Tax=Allobaculum TaxID=174708 RepID=UPI001E4CF2A6|nr:MULTISPECIES: nitroreductase family protein [Allobaculum]UNT93251.1 nitroreductase family protein [Allobaculum sp. Allo2]